MANNKAAGKDGIAVELLKYAPDVVFEKIAEFLNNIFEIHEDIITGTSVLVPLQKPPPKAKGPVKNLRPINLLLTCHQEGIVQNRVRKIGEKHREPLITFTKCVQRRTNDHRYSLGL